MSYFTRKLFKVDILSTKRDDLDRIASALRSEGWKSHMTNPMELDGEEGPSEFLISFHMEPKEYEAFKGSVEGLSTSFGLGIRSESSQMPLICDKGLILE